MIFVQVVTIEAVSISRPAEGLAISVLPGIFELEWMKPDEPSVSLCQGLARKLDAFAVLLSANGSFILGCDVAFSPVSAPETTSTKFELPPLLRALLMLYAINLFMPSIAFWLPCRTSSTLKSSRDGGSGLAAASLLQDGISSSLTYLKTVYCCGPPPHFRQRSLIISVCFSVRRQDFGLSL